MFDLLAPDRVAPAVVAPSRKILEDQLPALRAYLLRQARRAVDDAAQAEDLVQETLLAVMQQHQTRRGEATLHTWAAAILKHKVADWYRSPDRRRLTQFDHDPEMSADDSDASYATAANQPEPVPAWQQPDRQVERHQMMRVLERCMAGMPPQARRVFMMREWLGFEVGEICARLGLRADNCRMILHRARLALRISLQRDWHGVIEANA